MNFWNYSLEFVTLSCILFSNFFFTFLLLPFCIKTTISWPNDCTNFFDSRGRLTISRPVVIIVFASVRTYVRPSVVGTYDFYIFIFTFYIILLFIYYLFIIYSLFIIISYIITFLHVYYIFKQNKFQAKTMFDTDETVPLAEWIIDDTCLVLSSFSQNFKEILRQTAKNNARIQK